MPELADSDEEWEVEDIVDKHVIKNEWMYMVKWKHWHAGYSQWAVEEDIMPQKQLLILTRHNLPPNSEKHISHSMGVRPYF